jgi:hypothetical protein
MTDEYPLDAIRQTDPSATASTSTSSTSTTSTTLAEAGQ